MAGNQVLPVETPISIAAPVEKKVETDHGRDRMAGQAENRGLVAEADNHGFAGLEGDTVDQYAGAAETLNGLLAKIAHADRTAAGEEDDIVFCNRLLDGRKKNDSSSLTMP